MAIKIKKKNSTTGSIALHSILVKIDKRLMYLEDEMINKDDLKSFATKDDLKSFATKDDLKSFATKDDLKSFATKDDLKSFATKDDLKDLATKNDIKRLEEEIEIITIHLVKLEHRVTEIEYKMVTKEELMEMKSEILNHIDALAGTYKKHDQELVFIRHRFENLETRVIKLEEKTFV